MTKHLIAAVALIAIAGLANTQSASTTTLQFMAVDAGASLTFNNVLGSTNLTITPSVTSSSNTSSQIFNVSDLISTEGGALADEAIGVQVYKRTGQTFQPTGTASIDKHESLVFTFSQAVVITGFNMDYATGQGAKLFTLSVDGGLNQNFKLNGSDWLSAGLLGTTFKFGTPTNNVQPYAIDSVSLSSLNVSTPGVGVVTAVPEPETYALMTACLGVMALVTRRRKTA